MATIAVGCSHVSGLLVQPLFTTAGPDHFHGLDTRDIKKVFPPRRPTDQHHAISTSATRDALRRVPLALALQWCTAVAAITPSPSLLFGSRARLPSILGGAMAGLVDATVDHDGPGDPCGLIGDCDRRLLGRHAAEQLRDPGMLVGAFLRLAYNSHRAVNENRAQIAIALLGNPLLLDPAASRIVFRHEADPR